MLLLDEVSRDAAAICATRCYASVAMLMLPRCCACRLFSHAAACALCTCCRHCYAALTHMLLMPPADTAFFRVSCASLLYAFAAAAIDAARRRVIEAHTYFRRHCECHFAAILPPMAAAFAMPLPLRFRLLTMMPWLCCHAALLYVYAAGAMICLLLSYAALLLPDYCRQPRFDFRFRRCLCYDTLFRGCRSAMRCAAAFYDFHFFRRHAPCPCLMSFLFAC